MMVALREGFPEGCQHAVDLHDRTDLQKTSKHDHVESLDEVHLGRRVHRIDAVNLDVLPCRRLVDSVAVVDDDSARLHLRFELLQRRLVQHDGDVVAGKNRRGDRSVADDHGDVSRTAALFRTVGRHPGHFLAFHQTGISQNLTHREDTLSSESSDYYLVCHSLVDLKLFNTLVLEVAKVIEGEHILLHPLVGLLGTHLPTRVAGRDNLDEVGALALH